MQTSEVKLPAGPAATRPNKIRRATAALALSLLCAVVASLLGVAGLLRNKGAGDALSQAPTHAAREAIAADTRRPEGQESEHAAELVASSHELAGRVRSPAGKTLSGATVCLNRDNESAECTLTDSSGRFAFAGAGHDAWLIASAPGYLPRRERVQGTKDVRPLITLTLEPGGVTISGIVADAIGGIVPQALVRARQDSSGPDDAAAYSDAGGRFSLSVPAGPTQVQVHAQGYSRADKKVVAPRLDLRLVVVPASTIFGRVLEEKSGAPIRGARVTASGSSGIEVSPQVVLSGDDGDFAFTELASGGYNLAAVAGQWRSTSQWVTVAIAQRSGPVTLSASSATTVAGFVEVAGKPCPTGYARMFGPVAVIEPIGDDGRVLFQGLLPGRYRVNITCSLSQARSRSRVLTPPGIVADPLAIGYDEFLQVGSTPMTRVWSMRPPSNEADNTRDTGVGTIRVAVDAVGHPNRSLTTLLQRADGFSMWGDCTDAACVFDGVELGEYDVYVEEFPKVSQKALLQSPGQSIVVRLEVPPVTTISGRVVDHAGSPVPEAWIRATTIEVPFGDFLPVGSPVLTDSDGNFTLNELFTGAYRIAATSSAGGAQLSPVAAGARDVLLQMDDYGSLSGAVKNAADESVNAFRLTYRRRGEDGLASIDSTTSVWSLPWLPPGTYDLIVNSKSGNGSQVAVLAPGAKLSLLIRVNPQDTSTAHDLLASAPDP